LENPKGYHKNAHHFSSRDHNKFTACYAVEQNHNEINDYWKHQTQNQILVKSLQVIVKLSLKCCPSNLPFFFTSTKNFQKCTLEFDKIGHKIRNDLIDFCQILLHPRPLKINLTYTGYHYKMITYHLNLTGEGNLLLVVFTRDASSQPQTQRDYR
jgi:hypothetical protein